MDQVNGGNAGSSNGETAPSAGENNAAGEGKHVDAWTTPWFVWPVYGVACVAGASSAAITKSMHDAEAFALAGWRHQVSALILLPGFLWQWTRLPESDRRKARLPRTIGLLFMSSVALAAHFGSYIWSLNNTSMSHCLFLTCLSPIFVAVYTKLTGGALSTGEVVGVSLALIGASILATGSNVEEDKESSHVGDLAALSSAVFMAVYLTVGRHLRSWMPLFVYQFPVTVLAAFILGVGGMLVAELHLTDSDVVTGPFDWITKEYLLGTICLGIGPGFLGHAGYSVVLKYGSSLLVPAGMSLQPIIGTALGWAAGESSVPGLATCLGGLVTLSGTLCVSYASHAGKTELGKPSDKSDEEYQLPAADEEGQQGTKPLLQASERP